MEGSKNSQLLERFTRYCVRHPDLRFWQALRSWSRHKFILADGMDTFYWEGKTAPKRK